MDLISYKWDVEYTLGWNVMLDPFTAIRMLERLSKDESQLHEDMVLQLHQMQDTVRYTFFECFLALSGE